MHEVTRFSYPASPISANCRATTVIIVSSGTMSEW
ncbi:unknown [Alistipes sp. CAG:53]|nr:unknown [Alistipes sp. CAG:53]